MYVLFIHVYEYFRMHACLFVHVYIHGCMHLAYECMYVCIPINRRIVPNPTSGGQRCGKPRSNYLEARQGSALRILLSPLCLVLWMASSCPSFFQCPRGKASPVWQRT